jgi:putative copper export protein
MNVMLAINLHVIQVTLHVLAASVWVGGLVLLLALSGPLQRTAPEAVAPAAWAFARVGWPAFVVLFATGVWMLAAGGELDKASQVTLMVKLMLVALSALGAALQTFVKGPAHKVMSGAFALVTALGAMLLGVSL